MAGACAARATTVGTVSPTVPANKIQSDNRIRIYDERKPQVNGSYKRSVHGASNQATAAATRSAARRQCPKCGRKSALVRISDEGVFGQACRWEDCDYRNLAAR